MKKYLAVILVLMLIPAIVYGFDAGAREALSPITATGISKQIYNPVEGTFAGMFAKEALVSVTLGALKFTVNGTTPTSAAGTNIGHRVIAGQSFKLEGINDIKNFRCISDTSTVASVEITTFF